MSELVNPDLGGDWLHQAACLAEDPELFFPRGTTTVWDKLQAEEAKSVCRECDVRERCLQWALETDQKHGIWGGMSEGERQALKRRMGRRASI